MFVIVGTRTDAHSLRSHVGIGSESDCLFGQSESDVKAKAVKVAVRDQV